MHLSAPLQKISSIKKFHLDRLKKLGIETVGDLLWHFPTRYDDFSQHVPIAGITPNARVTLEGTVRNFSAKKSWRKKLLVSEATLADETGSIRAIWFGQKFLESLLVPGRVVRLSGKAVLKNNELFLQSPECEPVGKKAVHTASLVPVYPETEGLTSKWLRWQIRTLLPRVAFGEDIVPEDIRTRLHLPSRREAFFFIHAPQKKEHAQIAQKYFAFEEMFLLQLFSLRQKKRQSQETSLAVSSDDTSLSRFIDSLPFALTQDQQTAVTKILEDLGKPHPMNRLLNGDVGSGKTVVATIAARHIAQANYQTALLAPTEVLALQHFSSISSLLQNESLSVGLFTRSYQYIRYAKQSAPEILNHSKMKNALASGLVDICIGTHALLQNDVTFKNLALVIIDEQHRFGVRQRALLTRIYTDLKQTHTESKLLHEDLTYKIRGAFFEVQKELGLGHKEIIYQKALEEELTKRGLSFEKEKVLSATYKGKSIGVYRPDFVIEKTVIVELKSVKTLALNEKRQVWQYLTHSSCPVALLVNFGSQKVEIQRFIHTTKDPHGSVSHPHESASAYTPHLLSMTATPIPRTLSLTLFGNLDISLLETMPKNRLPIRTKIVEASDRENAYTFIRSQIAQGRQAYIILPFVEESEAFENVKAAVTEYERLQKNVFPDLRLGLLHGRLKAKEKESVMQEFKERKTAILVATSVVEVGVDVPNATVMIIENADRFGLSQLHQFRGRIGRGQHQSYCFLFAAEDAENPSKRMRILEKTNSGFEIAEEDLKLRGPGQFLGARQSGLPDVAMESMGNMRLIAVAQKEAKDLFQKNPTLDLFPALRQSLQIFDENVHME